MKWTTEKPKKPGNYWAIEHSTFEAFAEYAYLHADAMLEARKDKA